MSPVLGAPTVGTVQPPPVRKAVYPASMQITIATADGRYRLTGLIGQNAPTITDGRGGWQEVARSRKPSVIEWLGPNTHKAAVEILLDAWATGDSLDAQLVAVEGIAPVAPVTETPVVTVIGWPLIPTTVPWVVQAATPSDVLRREDGRVVRVTYSFELLQWRQGDVVVRNSPAKAAAAKAGTARAKPRTHVVQGGETLSSIAAKYLGSASKWPTLAKLNGLRSSSHIHPGQKIRLS